MQSEKRRGERTPETGREEPRTEPRGASGDQVRGDLLKPWLGRAARTLGVAEGDRDVSA